MKRWVHPAFARWAFASCLMGLGGCSSMYETLGQEDHERVQSRVSAAHEQLHEGGALPGASLVVDATPRFTRRSVPFLAGQMLPAHIGNVTMRTAGQHSLKTVGEWIERLTRIPVQVTPDALLPESMFFPGLAETQPGGTTAPVRPGDVNVSQKVAQALQRAGAPRQMATQQLTPLIEVNYQGSLQGLLDQVAASAGVQWTFQGGQIRFFRVITRNIQVRTVPGNLSQTGGVQLTSGMSVSSDLEMNVWTGIEKSVADMVSRQGKVRVDPSMGNVSVRDAAANVEAIERYLESLNRQLSRQVSLGVEVLQVTLNNQFQKGIDWNYVRETAKLGTFSGGGLPLLTSNAASVGFVKPNSSGTNNALMIKALESFGRVSTTYSSVITTMNRQPVPLGSTSTQSYLRQIAPSMTTTSSGTMSFGPPALTPGDVVTGFSINLLPIVLDSNMVLMQCGISISALKEMAAFSSGNGMAQQTVQQPNVSNFVTQQRMAVRSGDTIVLSGFENEATESRQTDLKRDVLPGTSTSSREKNTLVVLITPRLLDY